MKTAKAKTVAQMAELYEVTEEDLINQIEHFPALKKALENTHFLGKIFFPKQQAAVFRFLGEPEEKQFF